MTRLERLDKYLKEYGMISLSKLPNNDDTNVNFYPLEYLKLLENKLDNFNYKEDVSYLNGIFPRLSFFLTDNINPLTEAKKKSIQRELKIIHEKMQILLIRKPGHIDKKEIGYQQLLKLIEKVENLSLSYLYDIIEHFKNSQIDLMEYLVFEIKTYSLVENAIKKYPYMVRTADNNGITLIEKIISKYLEELKEYTKDRELSLSTDLVYYDQLIDLFLCSSKTKLSPKLKIELLGRIDNLKNNINESDYNELTKRKYIFWLNNLNKKIEMSSNENKFDTMILGYKHDIEDVFDQGIISEASTLYNTFDINKFKNREVITNEYIITIDGDGAEEIDDSFSIKKLENGNYLIGIHIADPGGYINQNSIIMDEIYKRTTSIYLSDKTIPMIHPLLSKDILSLLENKYRLATSYYLNVNSNGIVEDFCFKKSIVKVNRNESYKHIDKFLNRGYADSNELDKMLEYFSLITPKLSQNFNISELYSLINRSNKNVSNTNIIGNSSSAKIVETNMIMTNHLISKFFKEKGLPFINRSHKITPEYLDELKKKEKLLHKKNDKDIIGLIQFLENSYPCAEYSILETSHAGLGLSHYSHVTSPLRRSADILATSICIDRIYFQELKDLEIYKLEQFLKEQCEYINKKHPTIVHFEKIYEKEKIKQLRNN